MIRKLTTAERRSLIQQHRAARDRKHCDRIKAVLMHDDGYSNAEIARVLLIDDETVRRHIIDYIEKNKLSLGSGGSDSQLNDAQTQELLQHLHVKTYLYVKDICAYVRDRYGVQYSQSGMTHLLKRHGFRYKKPQPTPGKVAPQLQAAFKLYYEKLKQNNVNNRPIYFVDSVHPQHQTRLCYGWIRKGFRKNIGMTGKQKRLNFIGGLCLSGHKLLIQRSERVDASSIKLFLKQLRSRHKGLGRIHVIWDNAGYHRSREVKGYAAQLAIELHYLPPYSPNLNPIERLWKLMHESVSYNRYYERFCDFVEATLSFFKTIGRKKRLLRSRISDKFQIVDRPNLAF